MAAARELDRLRPAEVVLSDEGESVVTPGGMSTADAAAAVVAQRYPALAPLDLPCTLYDDWRFELGTCRQALLDHFQVTTLAGYGCEDLPQAIRAAGVLVQYLKQHQPSALAQLTGHGHLYHERLYDAGHRHAAQPGADRDDPRPPVARLAPGRARHDPHPDGRAPTAALDQPAPAGPGARWRQRLTAVDTCVQALAQRTALRKPAAGYRGHRAPGQSHYTGDRPARASCWRSRPPWSAWRYPQPRATDAGREHRVSCGRARYPLDGQQLGDCAAVAELIGQAIVDEPPATLANGGVIRRGYSSELDAIENSVAEAKRWVASLERVERDRTGIKTLKVGYNKVFGYYLEITHANTEAVPSDYIRKQTLVNAERYITPELKEREALILNAAERTQELETLLFRQLLIDIGCPRRASFCRRRQALAHLDVYLGLGRGCRADTVTCAPSSPRTASSTSSAGGIPWWSACCPRTLLCPTTRAWRPTGPSTSSPGRT